MNRGDYLLHFRPRTVTPSTMLWNFTWGLGGTATVLVVLLLTTGMMLKFVYIPTPDRAYASIVGLQQTVPLGGFMRNIHHWSANLLILITFLHMLRVFLTGAFKQRRQLNWLIGLGLMAVVVAANFTGYLLPWDQLAYWAVTICASLLAYLPGIGNRLREIVIGGQVLGPATLTNFYALHTAIIPAVLIALLPFHFWRIRKAGGLAAAQQSRKDAPAEAKIDVIPHLLVRELAVAAMVTAVVVLMAAFWDAPLAAKANPGLSPNPTKAPWYFAGLQELLLHLHPMLAVAILPPLLAGVLIALPFLPFCIPAPGVWFGSARGRRICAAAALLGTCLTPAWIFGHAHDMQLLAWLAPLIGLAALAAVYAISRRRLGANHQEALQGVLILLLTIFIILTINGIWFRGEGMALRWPW